MFVRALLDQTCAGDAALVAWEASPDIVEEAAIDLKDDLQVTGYQLFKPLDWPFFESFGQQRMIGVGERS